MKKTSPRTRFRHVDREGFRDVASKMTLPIVEFDLDLNLVFANQSALVLLGLDRTDLEAGLHARQLTAQEHLQLVEEGIELLINGEIPNSISMRLVRKDGVQIPSEVYAELIFKDGTPDGVIVYAFDLSRRIAIEGQMHEKEDIFELIIEHSSVIGILIVDGEYKFEWINDKLCDILGRRRSEIIGHDFREFLHPDSVELVTDRYLRRQKGEEVPTQYEFKIIKKDGTIRDVQITSSRLVSHLGDVKTVAQLLDITEEKSRKKALEASEERYRTLVETMTAGLGVDDENGIIIYANNALHRMLGYDEGELIGTPGVEIIHGLSNEQNRKRKMERMAGEIETYEALLERKDGELVPAVVSAAPIVDKEGGYLGSFAIFSDVSDLKKAEDEVRFLLDLLMHDIGNQLQIIIAGADLVKTDDMSDRVDRARQYILDGANRCLKLISKVRGAEESKYEPVVEMDLIEVLRSEMALLSRQYEVKLSVESIPEEVMIYADSALGQLIWNIMENAVRHNPNSDRKIWVTGETKETMFELCISDNGTGLTEKKKTELFDTTRRYGGVGLHLVTRIAEKYGGKVSVRDRVDGKPEEGLTVCVLFQLTDL